jgi:hypothetical protein|tara:strand:+ start:1814 stop:4510 length:2697 start_codon:yes stop_codon:yes gene_type:complete
MSVQLIVYPQIYNGYNSAFTQTNQFCEDGVFFNTINTSLSYDSSGGLQSAIVNQYPYQVNTWYRYRSIVAGTPTLPTEVSGGLTLYSVATSTVSGVYQRLSNIVVGTVYEIVISISTTGSGFVIPAIYDGGTLVSSNFYNASLSQITFPFTATTTTPIITVNYFNTSADNIIIDEIGVNEQGVTPTQTYSDLLDGQVICDLYEDEDIPLSLSVDDFTNVAEKVQSYSKAFNLPATKRNNKIFDHIFEITRTDTGLNFNPYKKTKCVLKQDGFLLFEGYLRMIDISDKSGEISYNVNLYSEAVALSSFLGERTFSDLDFAELRHDYQKQNIERSWRDAGGGASMTYLNPNASGFRDDYTTLRYPFIDWAHQIIRTPAFPANSAISGMPELLDLQAAFRPCINVKYLIDRMFQDSPYSYQSEFFESDLFTKLYMDFNWGENINGIEETSGIYDTYLIQWCTTASFTTIGLSSASFDPQMGYAGNKFTAQADGQNYDLSAEIQWENAPGSPDQYVETRWAKYNSSGTLLDTYDYINANVIQAYPPPRNTSAVITCDNAGDYIQLQWKASTNNFDLYLGDNDATCTISGTTGTLVMTTNTLLQSLRGELNQWEFLKGLINMFNLVTMPHPNNPEKIIFEPYYNMFLDNDDSKELNWTDKVDVSEIKLTTLTDLNRITEFKFAEDKDDYVASVVKEASNGHPYGTLDYIAPSFSFNLLTGEEEISAEPFAASVPKALDTSYAVSELITPAIYSQADDGTSSPFENSPRLFFNNGIKSVGSGSYYIPEWNGMYSANWTEFLQFSHLTDIPTGSTTIDINYETQQTLSNIGTTTANLFSLFWLPYFNQLYNPDTRLMTIKVNLSPSDVSAFNFFDTVMIKNRIYRVNKIDYKPNDLATVEFILIP